MPVDLCRIAPTLSQKKHHFEMRREVFHADCGGLARRKSGELLLPPGNMEALHMAGLHIVALMCSDSYNDDMYLMKHCLPS